MWFTWFEAHSMWHWQSVSMDTISLMTQGRVAATSFWSKKIFWPEKTLPTSEKRHKSTSEHVDWFQLYFGTVLSAAPNFWRKNCAQAGSKRLCGCETEMIMVNNSISHLQNQQVLCWQCAREQTRCRGGDHQRMTMTNQPLFWNKLGFEPDKGGEW